MGIPGMSRGRTEEVAKANVITQRTATLLSLAHQAGTQFILENPANRGDAKRPFLFLSADHAPIWLVPQILSLLSFAGASMCTFPMCAFSAPWQKFTSLAYSPGFNEWLDPLDKLSCDHATHDRPTSAPEPPAATSAPQPPIATPAHRQGGGALQKGRPCDGQGAAAKLVSTPRRQRHASGSPATSAPRQAVQPRQHSSPPASLRPAASGLFPPFCPDSRNRGVRMHIALYLLYCVAPTGQVTHACDTCHATCLYVRMVGGGLETHLGRQ